jgi:ferritin-like metal-binding protein YciE
MGRQSERLDHYPEIEARVTAHLGDTNEQLKRLEQCLEACGESTCSLKDAAQSVMANAMAMARSITGDEILKNIFANNAFENLEIAAYKSLPAPCGQAVAESARAPLETSARQEQRTQLVQPEFDLCSRRVTKRSGACEAGRVTLLILYCD